MFEFGAQSKWIWLPDWKESGNDGAVLAAFRKEFYLDSILLSEKKRECMICISADSRYKLYVNGSFAEYGPAKGDDAVRYYDTVNIGPFLKEGQNAIAIEVLRYPAGHNAGNHSVFRAGNPGLYLEEVTEGTKEPILQTWQDLKDDAKNIAGGGRIGITADASYACRLTEHFEIVPEAAGFAPLQIMEKRAGEAEMQGWKLPGFDDSNWQRAEIYNAFDMNRAVVPGNLTARPIPFMYRKKKKFSGVKEVRESASGRKAWNDMLCAGRAVTIPPFTREIVEIDAGEEECGFLSLKMAGGADAQVTVLCAEAYAADVRVMPDGQRILTKSDRCDSVHGELVGYSDSYLAGGFGSIDAPEIYEPFWFRTFRFVRLEVETGEKALTVLSFDFEETGYPLTVLSKVETSDASMGDIWDISLRTLCRCMHETYVDCPFYEQLQYAMDARSEILYTYSISMDDRLARSCMESFRRSQRYDGLLNCSSPNCEPNVIPGFSIYYILMLYDHMMYFGDKEFLKRHLGCMDGILNYFDGKLDERGLVGVLGGVLMEHRYWSFIDWTAQWNETAGVPTAVKRGPVTMESLLYILGLMAGAEILDYVGRTSAAEEYRGRADTVKKAVCKFCMDENGLVTDGPGVREYSQHGQVFAILTELVPKEQGRKMLQKTLEDTETFAQCSVAMAYYLFRALEAVGLYEYTDEKWELWRQMKAVNLTTCVEDGVNGRSDCHAWGALALYELPSVVLGVRPAAPGYEKVRIAPQTGRLSAASGDVVTKKGNRTCHMEQKRRRWHRAYLSGAVGCDGSKIRDGGTDITNDGCIGPKSTAFYELRARGGAAAVTVSECMVHPQTDGSHAYHLDESILNSLAAATYTADAIRRHGAIPSLELSHSGMYAGTYMTDKNKQKEMNQWGPSDTVRPDGVQVKALSKEQIDGIVASYGHVAGLAKRAGFEMLMIHGGHGWLINQFLSPMFNRRTDEYGGSLENRCRLAIEVLKAVRESVGPYFPIEFRMSGSELVPEGYGLEEGIEIAKTLEPYVDIIHVSAGTYQRSFGDTHPSMFKEHGCNVYLAAEIKKHVSKPVATIGALNDPAQMEEIIASGKADIVYMARALLADPELPKKVAGNRDEEIVNCLRCFTCMAERAATSTRRCTVNPLIGREIEGSEIYPAPVKKKVLIAGGGPGGLYAAYTAARRGHQVILCEKEAEPGGILRSEQALPFKREMYELAGTYLLLAKRAGAEIRTSTEVTPEYVEKEAPDALIIAVGSEPLVPPVKGLDGENVIIVNNYYLEKDKVADDVVVFGGGLAGCECAIHLGMEGKKVHLVEMRDELAPDANVRHRPLLLKEIEKYITVHTSCKGTEVNAGGIVCETPQGEHVLVPGKTVICALGQRSRTKAVDSLRDSAPYVAVIGDASRVSTITNAVYQGYHAALDI